MLITKQEDLETFCKELQKEKFITVDTEFIRDSTYWAKLCLIQVAGGNTPNLVAAIDPLVDDINLDCFYEILDNKDILKVMHGCRQDIEIFYHETKNIPKSVFDTQIAGMVCGFGDQVSYEKLVKSMLKQEIDKSSRYTDWAKRPLNDKQLKYALADVTYLRDIYVRMKKQLITDKRESWITDDHAILLHHDTYDSDPKNAWKRLKIKTTKSQVIANLYAIAKWREETAQNKNRPRPRIMRDDILQNLALNSPKTINDFNKIRRFPKDISKPDLESLLKAIKNAKPIKNTTEPRKTRISLSEQTMAIIELLRVLLKYTCEEHGIAPKLLATSADLEALALDDNADISALKGWRNDIFGKRALDLKHGRYGIAIKQGKLVFFPI